MARFPSLPAGFGGRFSLDPDVRSAAAGSRGPVHVLPAAVLTPASPSDVVLAVRWAAEAGLALVPRGGATGMPGGNVGPGVALELADLDTIEVDPDREDVLACGAGAIAADVRDRAERIGRRLPWLPSSAPWCTVGGMVACNAAGARSFRFGATRAHLAWVEVVRGDGTPERLGPDSSGPDWTALRADLPADAIRAEWPAVRKNASGYALDRFLDSGDPAQLVCGSEGTLALVTRVGLETLPPGGRRAAALLGLPEASSLSRIADEARTLPAATACELFGSRLLEVLGGDGRLDGLRRERGVVLVEVEGSDDEAESALERLVSLGRDLGGSRVARTPGAIDALWALRHDASPAIARAAGPGRRSIQFMEDGVVPSGGLGAYLEGVEALLARHDTDGVVFGHAGDANLHVNPLVDTTRSDWVARVRSMLEEAVELVTGLGGTLSGEHGDGRLRAPFLERIWGPHISTAFRSVKERLDPAGVLNPGVVIPLPGQDPLDGLAAGTDRQLVARRTP